MFEFSVVYTQAIEIHDDILSILGPLPLPRILFVSVRFRIFTFLRLKSIKTLNPKQMIKNDTTL